MKKTQFEIHAPTQYQAPGITVVQLIDLIDAQMAKSGPGFEIGFHRSGQEAPFDKNREFPCVRVLVPYRRGNHLAIFISFIKRVEFYSESRRETQLRVGPKRITMGIG